MSGSYSTPERALSEAARYVREVLDCHELATQDAETSFEGAVPWSTVLRIMEDIGIDEPVTPPSELTELWTVLFRNVGGQEVVHVTLAFGSDGKLCAAGLYAS